MEKYNVSLSSGVVNVYQKTIPVRFANFDIKNTEIKPNTKIGTITRVQQTCSTKLKSCDVKKYDKPTVNSPNLTPEERKRFTKLLRKYDHLFAKHEYDLGKTHIIEHEIPLLDETPIKQRPYKIPYALQEECTK